MYNITESVQKLTEMESNHALNALLGSEFMYGFNMVLILQS